MKQIGQLQTNQSRENTQTKSGHFGLGRGLQAVCERAT